MPRVLIVTNDFPPRQGGIEAFVKALADRFDPADVVVYTSSEPGSTEYDATLPYPVIRDKTRMLLPTKRVRKAVIEVMKEHGADRILIGSSAPLGLMSADLKAAGAQRVVAITHGHEVWWAKLPISRGLLRKIGDRVDVLTYIATWIREQQAKALSPLGRTRQQRMTPGVDSQRFFPGVGGAQVRTTLQIPDDAPAVVCAARLVKRKGQDTLIKAWPEVLAKHPDARLILVGNGPFRKGLDKLVASLRLEKSVHLTGPVPWADIPPYFDAGDVFAMPSRTRLFGLENEGLPLVFLEAQSCEKPVIVGRSGGASDALEDGVTGYLVDPYNPSEVAERISALFSDRELAARMGKAGRERALDGWQWDQISQQCKQYLELD